MKLGTQQYVEKGHDGVSPTVELLSISSEENLIWDFSSWLLQRYPLSGIKIFMHPEHQVNISHRHFCLENIVWDFALTRTRYLEIVYIYVTGVWQGSFTSRTCLYISQKVCIQQF
jgi:hypothetical protein